MLIINADLFSGRENVTWRVDDESDAGELLRKLASQRDALGSSDAQRRLGFRGLHVRLTDDSLPERYELPAAFRLAGGTSRAEGKSFEIAEQVVAEMPTRKDAFLGVAADDEFKKLLREVVREGPQAPRAPDVTGAARGGWPLVNSVLARGAKRAAERAENVEVPEGAERETGAPICPYSVTSYEPAIWNEWPTLRLNNCYNYACNRITDTIAQPGRASGERYPSATCQDVVSAALRDGNRYAGDCFPREAEGLWVMGLCVWPGVDYHWYRLMDSGFWTHKPSILAVTPFDDCGNLILSPEAACRGPYDQWCGYIQTASTVRIW
jgi:hypothetical protein